MELSSESLELLQAAGDPKRIPDNIFCNLISLVCEGLLDSTKKDRFPAYDGLDTGVLKAAHAGLAILLLEAAKHDRDASNLSSVLEECKFGVDRINTVAQVYQDKKLHLRALLSNTGNNPPHIVDVDWRLDYYIKNNQMEKVNQAAYILKLKTEECGKDNTTDFTFACTQDQLQDLVGKLKDACKSLERTSQL